MLSIQKEQIRMVQAYSLYFYEKKGIPINGSSKKILVPSFLELRKQACEELLKKGFSHIMFASPYEANIIIRVFKCEHFPLGLCLEQKHNLWGFCCFVKEDDGTWTSSSEKGSHFEIDFSKCEFSQWLYQDEKVTYNCDFFDSYVIIK